jgi:hypothetical protein
MTRHELAQRAAEFAANPDDDAVFTKLLEAIWEVPLPEGMLTTVKSINLLDSRDLLTRHLDTL